MVVEEMTVESVMVEVVRTVCVSVKVVVAGTLIV